MPTTINPSDQTITNHYVQVGASNNLLSGVAPGASGNLLTSNATDWVSSPPAGVNKVIRQVFTSNGTYTPSSGMLYCDIEVVGSGGGGGGSPATSVTQQNAGGGGGGGGYARKVVTAATIGASQTVTIGAAGTAGSSSDGGTGGTTSLGSIVSATGGNGGAQGVQTQFSSSTAISLGGAAGIGSSGDFNISGNSGQSGVAIGNVVLVIGIGGSSYLCGVVQRQTHEDIATAHLVGSSGISYGCGGNGGINTLSKTAASGGVGSAGIIVITEYTT